MSGIVWVALLMLAVVAGGALCMAVVAPRPWDRAAGALAGITALAGLAFYVALVRAVGRVDVSVAAAFLDAGAVAGGFALASALLPSLTRSRAEALAPAPEGPAAALCVVVLADAEPDLYDPAAVTADLDDLEGVDVELPPPAARVFAYAAAKSRYSVAGISPSRASVAQVAGSAARELGRRGIVADVARAFRRAPRSLAGVAASRAAAGTRHLVVVPLGPALTRSLRIAEASVDLAALEAHGASFRVARALWGSAGLAEMVARRILAVTGDETRARDGVVLVCPGRPWQWDESDPDTAAHETFFCQRVRSCLVEEGLDGSAVRIAYLEWQEPDVEEAVRHLAATGCRRAIVAAATYPVASLDTITDLPAAMRHAAAATGIEVCGVGPWGDAPEVASAIADAVEEVLGPGHARSGDERDVRDE